MFFLGKLKSLREDSVTGDRDFQTTEEGQTNKNRLFSDPIQNFPVKWTTLDNTLPVLLLQDIYFFESHSVVFFNIEQKNPPGARILGNVSTILICPFLQCGHIPASNPVNRFIR